MSLAFHWSTCGLEELCILTQNLKLCCQRLSWRIGATLQNLGKYVFCNFTFLILYLLLFAYLNMKKSYSASIMKNNKITQRNIQLYFPEHIMDIADFIPTSKIYYVSILVCIFRTRDGLANKNGLIGISKILSNVIVCIEWNNVIQFCLPFFLFILCQIRILYKFNITKEDWLCWIKQFQVQNFQ